MSLGVPEKQKTALFYSGRVTRPLRSPARKRTNPRKIRRVRCPRRTNSPRENNLFIFIFAKRCILHKFKTAEASPRPAVNTAKSVMINFTSYLEKNNRPERIDMRSYERQGIVLSRYKNFIVFIVFSTAIEYV